MPSSVHRSPTLVAGWPMEAAARRSLAGVVLKGRPPLRPRAHQRHVYLIVRSDGLGATMSRYLIDQVQQSPNITLLTSSEVRELVGEGALTAVVLGNNRTGERQTLPVGALFVFIDAAPCTGWLVGSVARDEHGFVLTGQAARTAAGDHEHIPLMLETSAAVGDVRSGSTKRVASAVDGGSMAIRLVHEYLARQ